MTIVFTQTESHVGDGGHRTANFVVCAYVRVEAPMSTSGWLNWPGCSCWHWHSSEQEQRSACTRSPAALVELQRLREEDIRYSTSTINQYRCTHFNWTYCTYHLHAYWMNRDSTRVNACGITSLSYFCVQYWLHVYFICRELQHKANISSVLFICF